MRILVTGGTGLLGNNIVRQLADQGHQVAAYVRSEPDPRIFRDVSVDLVRGELLDNSAIDQAVAGADAVIHSAGVIHLGWRRLDESMRINRDGTALIADACLKYDKKLVLVGTVNTLAVGTRDQAADEETPLENAGGQVPCTYVQSKRAGVAEVVRRVNQGLRAAIVHPGFMLGPWDWKPSSGRMMLEVGKGWKPICPTGGCSVCDPRDVAAGTIAAIDQGRDDGRQYILAGANWTYKQLWTEMAQRMGTRPPIMKAGPVQLWLAGIAGDAWARLSGTEGDVNSAGVRMSSLYHWHDSSRARRELGYQTRDPTESLDASAEWIQQHHL
tara:strand:- start:87555 stop:88538 length:984 start_codon:yes stop_codon:yes gene_type:complete